MSLQAVGRGGVRLLSGRQFGVTVCVRPEHVYASLTAFLVENDELLSTNFRLLQRSIPDSRLGIPTNFNSTAGQPVEGTDVSGKYS